jgi:hypothetical protein
MLAFYPLYKLHFTCKLTKEKIMLLAIIIYLGIMAMPDD